MSLDTRGRLGTGPAAAAAALERATATVPSVTLAEVLASASLQTRSDRTYLLTPDELGTLTREVRTSFSCLEIGGQRLLTYDSTYFDSPDRALYRAHVQGRRRRVKVRTRTYADTGTSFFEVKLKGGRGETVKHRTPIDPGAAGRLTSTARQFLAVVLGDAGVEPPRVLVPVLTVTYRRATFVDLEAAERFTCDVDLRCVSGGRARRGPDKVLVESKSQGPGGQVDPLLLRAGIRPVRMSKYAVGTALACPELPAAPWSRLLRTEFGWVRAPRNSSVPE